MKSQEFKKITILLPCYREGEYLRRLILNLKERGFIKIVVITMNSDKETQKIIQEVGVKIIKVNTLIDQEQAILKGLYSIKNGDVLVITETDAVIDFDGLEEFIKFGQEGDYPLLFPQLKRVSLSEKPNGLSKLLKKRLGFYLDNPSFSILFINEQMNNIVKAEVSSGGAYIFYKFIKSAIQNKLKVGVFYFKIDGYRPTTWIGRLRWKVRSNSERYSPKKFINYTYPDIQFIDFRYTLWVAILGSAFTIFITIILKYIFKISLS